MDAHMHRTSARRHLNNPCYIHQPANYHLTSHTTHHVVRFLLITDQHCKSPEQDSHCKVFPLHSFGLAIRSFIHSHLTAFLYNSWNFRYHKGNHLFQIDGSFIDVQNVTVTGLHKSSLIYHFHINIPFSPIYHIITCKPEQTKLQ